MEFLNDVAVPLTLCVIMVMSLAERYTVAKEQPVFRWIYIQSMFFALVYVGLNLWLLFRGDSATTAQVGRFIGVASSYVVWYWAPRKANEVQRMRERAYEQVDRLMVRDD
jgi:hypothetical protein